MHLQQLRILFWLMILPWSQQVCAQQNSIVGSHSAQLSFHDTPTPKNISKQLYRAKSIFADSLKKSLALVEKNLAIAIQYRYKNEEALAHTILGEFNISLANYNPAVSHLKKANRIYLKINSTDNSIKTYQLLGDIFSLKQQYELAIQQWTEAEKLTGPQRNLGKQYIKLKLKIGDEHLKTPNYLKARPFYRDALDIAKKVNSQADIVAATIGLGKVEERKGANQSAEELFQSANRKATAINSIELTNSSFNSLSNLYQNSNNSVKNIEIQEKAIDFNTNVGNLEQALQNSSEMANALIEDGEGDKAIDILNQSSEIIKVQGNSEVKRHFYKTLSKAYEAKGDIEKSEAVTKEYNVLMDSFKLLEAQKQSLILAKNDIIQNTENKISLLEKDRVINEKTIQLLQQERVIKDESIKNQRTIMVFLGLGILLVGVLVFFIYRSNQQKQRNNQLLMLKSLRNQMNPHFIFNSLNSVNVYIAQQDERAANKYLADFSKLMRSVLNYSQNDFIPLAKELEILGLYLNLEHDRFKENFDFEINCPDSIDLEAYQIPPMLLQPIVENAIWHGLRYKPEKGFLTIQFLEESEGLKIIVTDNGIGREASLKHKTASQLKMKSTGIKNVKDRLEIIKVAFKKELSIEINDLEPRTKTGTVVIILLKT